MCLGVLFTYVSQRMSLRQHCRSLGHPAAQRQLSQQSPSPLSMRDEQHKKLPLIWRPSPLSVTESHREAQPTAALSSSPPRTFFTYSFIESAPSHLPPCARAAQPQPQGPPSFARRSQAAPRPPPPSVVNTSTASTSSPLTYRRQPRLLRSPLLALQYDGRRSSVSCIGKAQGGSSHSRGVGLLLGSPSDIQSTLVELRCFILGKMNSVCRRPSCVEKSNI